MQECRRRLLRVCRNAATNNFLPMVVLWVASVVVVFSYYAIPSVPSALEPLAHWQNEDGWIAAFLSRVVFCGVLPGIFIVCIKSLRPKYVLGVITVQTLWSGICGIVRTECFRSTLIFSKVVSLFPFCAPKQPFASSYGPRSYLRHLVRLCISGWVGTSRSSGFAKRCQKDSTADLSCRIFLPIGFCGYR